jgi:energy-converting hydrogenase A subunit D
VDEIFSLLLAAIVILGALTTALFRDPFDKLISLSLIPAGVIPFIVARGYLDVAGATALIAPLSTLFLLLLCRREPDES